MKIKVPTIIAAAAITLGLGSLGAGVIHAASDTSSTNPMSSLVNAIAAKFNLNAADVEAVFDDQHQQMEARRQQDFKDRVTQAATDGKLTQEQADKIIAKQAELEARREANRTAMQNMTEEERRAAMKTQRDALTQWATDNNIPMEFMPFGGPGRGFGHHGFGPRASNTANIESAQ